MISISKKIARNFIFPSMMAVGSDKLIRRMSGNSILNIMYHGVVSKNSNYFSPRHITAKQFERHLIYYKNNFNILSVSEAFKILQNKEKIKRKTITISFDDGFQNNLYNALPLLEKHKIPSTFFISSVCTENKGDTILWSELTAALNYFYNNETVKIENYKFKKLYDIEAKLSLNDFIKTCGFHKRKYVLDNLEKTYNLKEKIKTLPDEIWKLLTNKELVQLSQSNFAEIGSHGHSHFNLGEIEIEKATEELVKSKKQLDHAIGKDVNILAYPDGSYNKNIKNIAEKTGYKYQFAVNYKMSEDINDIRIMNRHNISSTTTFESNMIVLNKSFMNKGVKI